MYALWVLYAAVMNFKRAHDEKKLSKTGLVLGYPIFIVGIILDVYCNLIPLSLIMLEIPKEWTVSARVTRLSMTGGWRGDAARWFCDDLLDDLDPSGKHCS
jgi:hypothetical protein